MMLSRVAERVYWMARYLERTENTARLINVHTSMMMDLPKRMEINWFTLIHLFNADEIFHERYKRVTEENIMQFLIADRDNPVSLASSLFSVRENVRTSLDLLTEDCSAQAPEAPPDARVADAERQIEPDDREWFLAHPTAGGDPVIVIAMPDAPLRSILDQMTVYDSLILAMRYHGGGSSQNLFLVFAGAATQGVSDEPLMSFDTMGLTPESPLSDLLQVALQRHLTGVSAPAFC